MWLAIGSNRHMWGIFLRMIPIFTSQWERHGVDKFKKICKISFCFRYITFLLQILIFFNEYVMVKNRVFVPGQKQKGSIS